MDTPIITLDQWNAATVAQRQEWTAAKCRMRKGDIKAIQRERAIEARRIAYDLSYEGSREFQEDIGS